MRASRLHRDDAMLPQLERRLAPVEPMSPEQVEKVDDASMSILEQVGVVFRDPIALEDWKRAGAKVEGERVHLDRAHVRELIASIPSSVRLHARDRSTPAPTTSGTRPAGTRAGSTARWPSSWSTPRSPRWDTARRRGCDGTTSTRH